MTIRSVSMNDRKFHVASKYLVHRFPVTLYQWILKVLLLSVSPGLIQYMNESCNVCNVSPQRPRLVVHTDHICAGV